MHHHRPQEQSQRHGAILVLMTTLILIMLIMVAFTVDVAWMQLVRTELRAASDAAAKAGAEALSRTQKRSDAIAAAKATANRNRVAGRALTLRNTDIEVGSAELQPDGSWGFVADQQPYSSVRVSPILDGSGGNPAVGLFFGQLLGMKTFTPSIDTTAAWYEQDIVLCIDRSHSMCFDFTGTDWSYPALEAGRGNHTHEDDGDKHLDSPPHASESRWSSLNSAVDTFLTTINDLKTTPQIALVTWGSTITTASNYEGWLTGRNFSSVTRNSDLSTSYTDIASAIDSLGDDIMLGGTNMSAGMSEAITILTGGNAKPLSHKSMILMSDGQWNKGVDPIITAQTAKNANITIHTISFLDQADQTTMKAIAELTGGTHYFATNEEELKDAFRKLALSLPVILID